MTTFLDLVATELEEARMKHAPLNSSHEAYAVILEELCEFFDEAKLKKELRNPFNMLKELVQISAMAARAAYDLRLFRDVPDPVPTPS